MVAAAPATPVAWKVTGLPDNVPADPVEACGQATRIGATILQNHHAYLTGALVAALHEQGIAVWSWPTTDEGSLVESILTGADGVIGDDIRTMLRVLDRVRPLDRMGASS